MSKTKKYLLITAGALMLLFGVATAYFAVNGLFDRTALGTVVSEIKTWEMFATTPQATLEQYVQWGVAWLTSVTLISFGFAFFAIRYAFYSSKEFFAKRSIVITMAVLSVLVVNPLAGALFVVAVFMPDKNLVLDDLDLSVDLLEDKLQKLVSLKEKGLITDEEFQNLRNNLLTK